MAMDIETDPQTSEIAMLMDDHSMPTVATALPADHLSPAEVAVAAVLPAVILVPLGPPREETIDHVVHLANGGGRIAEASAEAHAEEQLEGQVLSMVVGEVPPIVPADAIDHILEALARASPALVDQDRGALAASKACTSCV